MSETEYIAPCYDCELYKGGPDSCLDCPIFSIWQIEQGNWPDGYYCEKCDEMRYPDRYYGSMLCAVCGDALRHITRAAGELSTEPESAATEQTTNLSSDGVAQQPPIA